MQGTPPGTPWQSTRPWPGQWGQGPQFGQPAPGYGGFAPSPPPRSRKPLLIGLSVGGALLVVVLVVVLVAVLNSGGGSASGADAVRGYLEALSRGDATAALSFSNDQPASKDLLTDEVLKKQVAQWPITNIQILDDNSAHSYGFGQVHVSAKFGDNTSDVTLSPPGISVTIEKPVLAPEIRAASLRFSASRLTGTCAIPPFTAY